MPRARALSHRPPPALCRVASVNPSQLSGFRHCFGVWRSVFGYLQRVGPGSLGVSTPSFRPRHCSRGRLSPASPAPGQFSSDCCGPSPSTEHAQRTLPGIHGGVQASRLRGAPGSATWSCPRGVRASSPAAPALICSDLSATRQDFLFWLLLVDLRPPHLHPLRFPK